MLDWVLLSISMHQPIQNITENGYGSNEKKRMMLDLGILYFHASTNVKHYRKRVR
jgi:hypothetical protein